MPAPKPAVMSRRAALAALAAAPLAGLPLPGSAPAARAAPAARLISPHWRQTGSAPGPDHQDWGRWLARHRSVEPAGVARVAYADVDSAGRADLAAYLALLAKQKPTAMTRAAAFAFWANLYNALTVSLVLEAWPVESIRAVRGGLFDLGPWDEPVVTIEGATLSLDDIEHGILRPVWRDPRVHYALNCAAVGCPNIGAAALSAKGLETTLDAAARAYVNHPRGVRFDGERLVVSSIYDWFQEDFGGSETGVLDHLRAHAEPALRTRLEGRTGYDDDAYDWAINAG